MSSNINDIVGKEKNKPTKTEVKVEAPLSKEINGKIYKIQLLNGEDGLDLWEFLLQKLLPSVGTGLDSMQHDSLMDGSPTTFAEAMIHLSTRLEGNTLKSISLSLFDGAAVDGKPLDFKEDFKGNYGAWRTLLAYAMKENFGSFFEEGWGEGIVSLMQLLPTQSAKPDSE